MPPLGPPYAEPPDRPPVPQFPPGPPEQWPTPPPTLPGPAPPVAPTRWIDDPKHRTVVWGAVVIVFAIIVGGLLGASVARDRPELTAAPSTTSDPSSATSSDDSESESDRGTTTTTEPESLEEVVLEIQEFVERERGLQFEEPVDVTLAGEDDFNAQLLEDFDEMQTSLVEGQQVLSALGLIPSDFDLIEEERALLSIGVVGFYDPETKELVVKGTEITPFVRTVLAHELTHALDDQWFDLDRPELDNPDDESSFGFLALVEGNARRVEDAYLASLSTDEQIEAIEEEERLLFEHPEIFDLPPVLLTLLQAPYEEGPPLVDDLLDTGGQSRLDGSFAAPPLTSEQVFDPELYVAGEGAVAVPAPAADGEAAHVGVLGALVLREMLFDSLPSSAQVQRAIAGWGGDSYVTWIDSAGNACLRDTFVGDTPGDTLELVQAITEWGADHDAVVDAPTDGPATFTVCAE